MLVRPPCPPGTRRRSETYNPPLSLLRVGGCRTYPPSHCPFVQKTKGSEGNVLVLPLVELGQRDAAAHAISFIHAHALQAGAQCGVFGRRKADTRSRCMRRLRGTQVMLFKAEPTKLQNATELHQCKRTRRLLATHRVRTTRQASHHQQLASRRGDTSTVRHVKKGTGCGTTGQVRVRSFDM